VSKKNQNVLRESAEALNRIADNLGDAVTMLYVIGTELVKLDDELSGFIEKANAVMSKPVTAIVDVEALAKALTKARGWDTQHG